MLNIKYPPYKEAQTEQNFLQWGNIVIGGAEIKRQLSKVMLEEGFPIPVEMLEEFIVASFQDAIALLTKYKMNHVVAIHMIEKLHDANWPGDTTWLVDYVELLLGKCIKNNPYGMWDVFFRNGDLYVMYQGDYAHMMYEYLKANKDIDQQGLPEMECVVLHHISGKSISDEDTSAPIY